jgi:hypothetical protein
MSLDQSRIGIYPRGKHCGRDSDVRTFVARAFPVLIKSEPGFSFLFWAFSSREPVSASLENVIKRYSVMMRAG